MSDKKKPTKEKTEEKRPMKTKRERFLDVVPKRVNQALHYLSILGNCASTVSYAYDKADVDKIERAISETTEETLSKFRKNLDKSAEVKTKFSLVDPAETAAI